MSTDWPAVHQKVVDQFRAGWDRPTPDVWDSFIGEDMEFIQPMLRNGVGPAFWHGETARVLSLMPDLRADVLSWAGVGETLFIHLRLSGTLGGLPLTWEAVDLLRLTPDGTAHFRESFFDPGPVAAQVIRRPTAWLRWWRSGVGPFFARRRMLRPVATESGANNYGGRQ
ncbi:MAG TPA: nuclear transport factor 2 family protein [Aeromicrobium sp.]|nr:nuclear transport factor 2 family protein [Aeromicrobium sp.]